MNGLVQQVNDRVHGTRLELLRANDVRFGINQLLFVDNTALAAEAEMSCVDW